jgi:hypothetical protein
LSLSDKNCCKPESGTNPKKCHYKAKYPILGVTQREPQSGRQGTLNSNSELDPVRKNRPLVDDELDQLVAKRRQGIVVHALAPLIGHSRREITGGAPSYLDARSTKDDQEYLFEPAPQYAFSPNQFRIAAHACARTPFYVFMSGQRGAFLVMR